MRKPINIFYNHVVDGMVQTIFLFILGKKLEKGRIVLLTQIYIGSRVCVKNFLFVHHLHIRKITNIVLFVLYSVEIELGIIDYFFRSHISNTRSSKSDHHRFEQRGLEMFGQAQCGNIGQSTAHAMSSHDHTLGSMFFHVDS